MSFDRPENPFEQSGNADMFVHFPDLNVSDKRVCPSCGQSFPDHAPDCAYADCRIFFELQKRVRQEKLDYVKKELSSRPVRSELLCQIINNGFIDEICALIQDGHVPSEHLDRDVATALIQAGAADQVKSLSAFFNESDIQAICHEMLEADYAQYAQNLAQFHTLKETVIDDEAEEHGLPEDPKLDWLFVAPLASKLDYSRVRELLKHALETNHLDLPRYLAYTYLDQHATLHLDSQDLANGITYALQHGFIEAVFRRPEAVLALDPQDREAFFAQLLEALKPGYAYSDVGYKVFDKILGVLKTGREQVYFGKMLPAEKRELYEQAFRPFVERVLAQARAQGIWEKHLNDYEALNET